MESTATRGYPWPAEAEGVDPSKHLQELAQKLDTETRAQADMLQKGCIYSSDWSTEFTINTGTGELTAKTNVGGVCWVPNTTVGIIRTNRNPAAYAAKPATLPLAGKQLTVGIELSAAREGEAPVIAMVSGAEFAEAETVESMLGKTPAVTANKVRVRDIVILNKAGVYEIKGERDRRPWAKGGNLTTSVAPVGLPNGGFTQVTGSRLECSGAFIEITASAMFKAGGGPFLNNAFSQDHVTLVGFPQWSGWGNQTVFLRWYVYPTPGSHFFNWEASVGGASGSGEYQNGYFTVRELLYAPISNGIS